jgi:hypothetical protein
MRVLTVSARSKAEMPVVTPRPLASTETVKAVPIFSVLFWVMRGRPSSSTRSPDSGTHMRPRPCFAMKLIASGVAISAAMTRSPSFSRPSSSRMRMKRPALTSSIASSTLQNGI